MTKSRAGVFRFLRWEKASQDDTAYHRVAPDRHTAGVSIPRHPVAVDHALRLKRQLGPDRAWVTAYANDALCEALRRTKWRRAGSNRQPPACKADALPIELRPQGSRLFLNT